MKQCSRCGEVKPLNQYYAHNTTADRLYPHCKGCQGEISRRSNFRRRYGITEEEYDRMFHEQRGCCAICHTHQLELKKALAVDHDHESGKVRGLLCGPCNRALGLFKDSTASLFNAINYLEQ